MNKNALAILPLALLLVSAPSMADTPAGTGPKPPVTAGKKSTIKKPVKPVKGKPIKIKLSAKQKGTKLKTAPQHKSPQLKP